MSVYKCAELLNNTILISVESIDVSGIKMVPPGGQKNLNLFFLF